MDLDVLFSRDDFTKDEFNIDRFLQESCQKTGLHKLHKELGMFIKYLQSMIVDLVNNECNAIVGLASDLKVLQNQFDKLSTPLGQLKEELMQIYKMIETNLNNIKYLLNKKEMIQNQKKRKMNELRMLTTSQKVNSILKDCDSIDNIDMEVIERSVNQYMMQHMYSQLCDGSNHTLKNTDILHRILNSVFLKSVEELDKERCTRCLQMYMLMNSQNIAEEIYRSEITKPVMYNIINESTLKSVGNNLSKVYDKIIEFIRTRVSYMLELTNRNKELTGFNFVLRGVWLEINEQLKLNLSSIYAPGNPSVFHERFTQTHSFLIQLEQCFSNDSQRAEFRRHDSFHQHQMRWNLKVYYEIRQIEIVEILEPHLPENITPDIVSQKSSHIFRLVPFQQAWEAMERCFAPDVYLLQLLDKFWKLTLQIVSRLNVWIGTILDGNIPLQADTSDDQSEFRLQFLSYLHVDITTLVIRLKGDLPFLEGLIPDALNNKIKLCIQEFIVRELPLRLTKLEEMTVELVYKECSTHVKNVSQIPRLYRKTNRSTPTGPSAYVESMCRPIELYEKETLSAGMDKKARNKVSAAVYARVTLEYAALAASVLTSVKRTEESLRRLKKTRGGESSNLESGDDQKIRAQLQLDLRSYASLAEKHTDISELDRLAAEAASSKEVVSVNTS